MRQVNKNILIMLAVLFVGVLSVPKAIAKNVSFDLTTVDIQADVTAEGDIKFTEQFDYDVDHFNGITRTIQLDGYNIESYKIGRKNPETGKITYFEEDVSHLPGTFQANVSSDAIDFKIYQPANNEDVSLVFEYTVNYLVTNYLDTAEINRKLIGENFIPDNFDFTATITLPGHVEKKEDFRAWLYGDPQGEVSLDRDSKKNQIKISVPNNQPNQFIEVHTIFPETLTPNNRNVIKENRKDEVIKKSNDRVEQDAKRYQKYKWLFNGLLALLILGSLFVTFNAWRFYLKKRREYRKGLKHVPEHVFELPEDITPAVMTAAYLKRNIQADDFSATIVDLARKGYIELDEVDIKRRSGLFNRGNSKTILVRLLDVGADKQQQLFKHEQYVLDYLFAKDDTEILLSDLEAAVKENSTLAKSKNRLWTRFKNNVTIQGAQKLSDSALTRQKAIRWISVGLSVDIIFFVGSIMLIAVFGDQYYSSMIWITQLMLLVNGIAMVVLSILHRKSPLYTAKENYKRHQWHSFGKMLEDIGQFDMREIASLPLWEAYLTYAVAFGVADKVLDTMNKQYGMDELETMTMSRPFYSNPYLLSRSLNSSVSNAISSGQPRSSSLSGYSGTNTGGFGGGASSGSSGGSGGGSMGGF